MTHRISYDSYRWAIRKKIFATGGPNLSWGRVDCIGKVYLFSSIFLTEHQILWRHKNRNSHEKTTQLLINWKRYLRVPMNTTVQVRYHITPYLTMMDHNWWFLDHGEKLLRIQDINFKLKFSVYCDSVSTVPITNCQKMSQKNSW